MIRVFIGYDPNETVAYHVLVNSIMEHTNHPISITPLVLKQLPLNRNRTEFQSTEFSFSRFLVPYLCNYEGRAIFMDCDMVVKSDIAELWDLPMVGKGVNVVKHNYHPKEYNKFLDQKQSIYEKKNWSSVIVFNNNMCRSLTQKVVNERHILLLNVVKHNYHPKEYNKFLDQIQSIYEKKNWSSLIVFNNNMCRALTQKVVNEESGMYLHQFKWLPNDNYIGEVSNEWNHLVNEENQCELKDAKLIHYTQGTPCFQKYSRGEAANIWKEEYKNMIYHNKIGEFSLAEKTGT